MSENQTLAKYKNAETNIFATSDRSVRKVNEELLEGWKQRDKYFCQKLRTECFGEIFFFFAILTSRTFIFKSIFQWWYRRLPSNEIVSYKSGKITHGGSLVTCRQFPRQICQIVWFRSNDFPSTSFHLKMGIFATLVTLSPQEITLMIIFNVCTFLSFPSCCQCFSGWQQGCLIGTLVPATFSHLPLFRSTQPSIFQITCTCQSLDLRGHICLN